MNLSETTNTVCIIWSLFNNQMYAQSTKSHIKNLKYTLCAGYIMKS